MPHLSGTGERGGTIRVNVQRMRLTKEQFAVMCQENRDLRFELTAQQELLIMPPTGSETGWRDSRLNLRLAAWAETEGTGLTFGSSTGFTLSSGAIRSPDASWIKREHWEALSQEQRTGFAPICPDFVAELRSPTDRLFDLHEKMQEYLNAGVSLGWLLDPIDRRVYVYRPGQPVETLADPVSINGDPVLPGFTLLVGELW